MLLTILMNTRITENNLHYMHLRITNEQHEQLKKKSDAAGVSMAQVIRIAINDYLNNDGRI
jgi:predicted HicB family RNase H-like nuclease